MADATKNCESFSFRLLSQVQKLLSSGSLAYKSTAAVASALQKDQTATALLTRCKAHSAAFVSVVSAVCLVHFLTLVSNLSKNSNNEYIARFVSVVSVRVDTIRGFRFGCFFPFLVSACKVITFLPTNQIFLEKYFLKNCKRTKRRFSCAPGCVCATWCKYAQNIVFYICIRVCACVFACVDA